jgi:hypothetical protein
VAEEARVAADPNGAAPLQWLESVDVIYDAVQARAKAQEQQIATLDAKGLAALTSASLLVGGAAALVKVILPGPPTAGQMLPLALGAAGAVVLYASIVIGVVVAYRPRTYSRAPEPEALVLKYCHEPLATAKGVIARAMAKAYSDNAKTIRAKARWTLAALIALGAEAIWLAIWLAVIVVLQV